MFLLLLSCKIMALVLAPNFNYFQIGTNVLNAEVMHSIYVCAVQVPPLVESALEKLILSQ